MFKAKFKGWEVPREDMPAKKEEVAPDAASVGASLHGARKSYQDSGTLKANKLAEVVDEGSKELTVYRIEGFKAVEMKTELNGHFFQGDSYVVHYQFSSRKRKNEILYFWQGQTSSTDEKAASALECQRLCQERGGMAGQVRVVMNKEPDHFYGAFEGGMVVHAGGMGAGWKNNKEADTYDEDGVSLFHVRGITCSTVHTVQVQEKAASLNSGDAFVLTSPTDVLVWIGKGCEAFERDEANKVTNTKGTRTHPLRLPLTNISMTHTWLDTYLCASLVSPDVICI